MPSDPTAELADFLAGELHLMTRPTELASRVREFLAARASDAPPNYAPCANAVDRLHDALAADALPNEERPCRLKYDAASNRMWCGEHCCYSDDCPAPSPNVRERELDDEDAIETVASELALIDNYDPNQLTPAGWAVTRDGYREKARRVLAALAEERDIPQFGGSSLHWGPDMALEARVRQLEDALEWYANPNNMSEFGPQDLGKRAEAVLASPSHSKD